MRSTTTESLRNKPDHRGFFGPRFGGRFVPETLMPQILELGEAYDRAKNDPSFAAQLASDHKVFTGRPSPFYPALRFKIGRAHV